MLQNGTRPLRGHARGEGDGVLFGDADVEGPIRHGLHHELQGASSRHGRRDAHDALVLFGELDDGVAEDVLVLRRLGRFGRDLDDLAGVLVEQAGRMPLGRAARLGRRIALALGRDQVQELGTGNVLEVAQHMLDLLHIVAVDGPEVAEVEGLEEVGLLEQ